MRLYSSLVLAVLLLSVTADGAQPGSQPGSTPQQQKQQRNAAGGTAADADARPTLMPLTPLKIGMFVAAGVCLFAAAGAGIGE
jgi:hypothetical protein